MDYMYANQDQVTVFSYTLTGAVRTERTKNIVEQSDWLFESKVYC